MHYMARGAYFLATNRDLIFSAFKTVFSAAGYKCNVNSNTRDRAALLEKPSQEMMRAI